MEKIEDKNLCKTCGGVCCKKSGCDYYVEDFEDLSMNGISKALENGNISVVAALDFKRIKGGKLIVVPLLYLRARNTEREVIDLLSMKTKCSMLTETGCAYDINKRPSGGAKFIPMGKVGECYFKENPMDEILKWNQYQNTLNRIVKRYTGKSTDAVLREDVKRLIVNIMKEEYKGISKLEIEDVKNMLPLLIEAYPLETKEAIMETQTHTKRLSKNR